MFIAVSVFLTAELSTRICGVKPWKKNAFNIKVQPNKPFFVKDSLLGFTTQSGRYNITLESGYRFTCNNTLRNSRLSHPAYLDSLYANKKELWLFGCSYTYGWALNDQQTMSWKLQKQLPDYHIVNYGKPAYSDLQCLLYFKQLLDSAKNKPVIVVLNYASFHDQRNVSTRSWRKTLAPYNKLGPLDQPVAHLMKNTLLIENKQLEYKPWPLMQYSAFIHLLEITFNKFYDKKSINHKISKLIVDEFKKICTKHKIKLILSGMTLDDNTKDMLDYGTVNKISTCNMQLDIGLKKNNLLPYDSHPNARANTYYAGQLYKIIISGQ